LHQHACAVADERIGAHRAAMGQVFEHEKPVLDDLVRLHALHLRDETHAAGIMLIARIVQALFGWQAGKCGVFDGRRIRLRGEHLLRHCRWRHVRHRHSLRSALPSANRRLSPKGYPFNVSMQPTRKTGMRRCATPALHAVK